jgi:hypothetical protein
MLLILLLDQVAVEGFMPRRQIGQETFGFEARDRVTALDELHGLIAWGPVETALAAIPVAERHA